MNDKPIKIELKLTCDEYESMKNMAVDYYSMGSIQRKIIDACRIRVDDYMQEPLQTGVYVVENGQGQRDLCIKRNDGNTYQWAWPSCDEWCDWSALVEMYDIRRIWLFDKTKDMKFER